MHYYLGINQEDVWTQGRVKIEIWKKKKDICDNFQEMPKRWNIIHLKTKHCHKQSFFKSHFEVAKWVPDLHRNVEGFFLYIYFYFALSHDNHTIV